MMPGQSVRCEVAVDVWGWWWWGADPGGMKSAVRVVMPYKRPNSRRGVLEKV